MKLLNGKKIRTLNTRIIQSIVKWQCLSAVTFLLFWLLWFIIDFTEYNKDGYGIETILFDYIYCSTFTLCVIAVCKGMMRFFLFWMKRRWGFVFISLSCLIINVLLSLFFEELVNCLFYMNLEDKITIEGFYIYSLISTFLSILLLSSHHYSLYIIELQERKKNELMILKQQLDPHFMFNNLNTLDALIESNPERAHIYLNRLSLCYRYFTKNINVESIEISADIAFIEMYNELLQISIPGHFIIEIEDGLKFNQQRIIPMSLQMLVENAVKHNCHSQENPIHINIKCDAEYIIITNTYKPVKQTSKTLKVGLENLKKRCLYIIEKKCVISHTDTLFEVKLPIIK